MFSMVIRKPRTHEHACDASGAVFIEPGSTRFLVADDEDQQQTLLRVFNADEDGPPLAEHHLCNDILEPDPEEPEIDLEGAAWLGKRIFWIGSHSNSRKGKRRPSRHRLFATTLRKGIPRVEGRPYRTLLRDLQNSVGLKLDPKLSPNEGGVSIEGLSSSATPGELLIAFRTPLLKKKAMVVPFKNPEAVIDGGEPARFESPMCLDLGGRGIRSLEYWPERSSYLIIAGPCNDEKKSFVLYRWSGSLSSTPELLDGFVFGKLGIGGSPEALLIERTSDTVYVLFDEGERMDGKVKCKKSQNQSFRSVAITGLLPS